MFVSINSLIQNEAYCIYKTPPNAHKQVALRIDNQVYLSTMSIRIVNASDIFLKNTILNDISGSC